ncbi:hypothetical protein CI102_15098, partial [Trichoderma harzianum]
MDNPQDILNFCLANKEYYGHYIGTLYRHNVRHDGSSALEWVAERGFLSVVSSILDVPRVDVVDLQNADGLTALHCAAGRGCYDLAKFLLEVHGANTEIRRNPGGFRPVEVAARDGQLRLVELLLSKGAEP